MNRIVTLIALFALCVGTVIAITPRPLTLDEKAKEADLIILGTASLFGEECVKSEYDSFVLYERSLRIAVKEILWPPSFTNKGEIIFPCYIVKTWPDSWWNHTNTAGVFFLAASKNPERGGWQQLGNGNDWIELPTNALAVLFSITRQRGKPAPNMQLQLPDVPSPQITRYGHNPKAQSSYVASFREGYSHAMEGRHGVPIFGPTDEDDKAKVLGYADGQLAGDTARSQWMRKLHLLMKANETARKRVGRAKRSQPADPAHGNRRHSTQMYGDEHVPELTAH
jgi:hypothetical protein